MSDTNMRVYNRSTSPVQNVMNYITSWFKEEPKITPMVLPVRQPKDGARSAKVLPVIPDLEMGGIPPNTDYVVVPVIYDQKSQCVETH